MPLPTWVLDKIKTAKAEGGAMKNVHRMTNPQEINMYSQMKQVVLGDYTFDYVDNPLV